MENKLKNVTILDSNEPTSDIVQIGSKVKIKDLEFGDIFEYRIVGSVKVSPELGRISDESPVGKALIGHRAGDFVKITIPAGDVNYEILGIDI